MPTAAETLSRLVRYEDYLCFITAPLSFAVDGVGRYFGIKNGAYLHLRELELYSGKLTVANTTIRGCLEKLVTRSWDNWTNSLLANKIDITSNDY